LAVLKRNELQSLPKCELHRHLDGSIRIQTIREIAQRHQLDLGCSLDELEERATISKPKGSLDEVLQSFSIMQRALCCYDAIKRVAFENVEDAYRDGVKLLELRFAPTFISKGKDTLHNDEIIEAVLDGIGLGMKSYEIEVGLIGIIPRSNKHSYTENLLATEDLIRYAGGAHSHGERLCGFDLADDEMSIPHSKFVPLVDMARASGLGITIHTGENSNARCVEQSINLYKPDRIGHGIRAIDSDVLVESIGSRDILLELCVTSNWLTHSVSSLEEHPLPRFYEAGIPISINSDDPQLMNIDLVHEYEICHQHFALAASDFIQINRDAVLHSFLPEDIIQNCLENWF
jgi:adenosine deaminase